MVLLPAAYLLSLTGSVNMIWLSFPIAEVASLAATMLFFANVYKKTIKMI